MHRTNKYTCAGFPSFPVLPRSHFDIFSGSIFPRCFVNQHADPFLFQLYRRFGAATYLPEASAALRNTIGGPGAARYAKCDVAWSHGVLEDACGAVAAWLRRRGAAAVARGLLTVDVLVPTFRCDAAFLGPIIELARRGVPGDGAVDVGAVVIVDNPEKSAEFRGLCSRYGADARVRLRQTPCNSGASAARNRALAESAAQWVIFLDDDVRPDAALIERYVAAIRAHGDAACGFVGNTAFPPPATPRQRALHVAGVAFFWGIAAVKGTAAAVPWGVTASLCVRRVEGVSFDTGYPPTGGGEDVDFCLAVSAATARPLRAAPDARAVHPYWNGGCPRLGRFWGWARGDGRLISEWPKLTYSAAWNAVELSAAAAAAGAAAGLAAAAAGSAAAAAAAWPAAALAAAASVLAADAAADALGVVRRVRAAAASDLPIAHAELAADAPLALVLRVAWEAKRVIWASEAGRLWGHVCRGELLRCIGRRFMWWGADEVAVVVHERRAARRRAVLLCAAAAAALACFAPWA